MRLFLSFGLKYPFKKSFVHVCGGVCEVFFVCFFETGLRKKGADEEVCQAVSVLSCGAT